MRAIDLVAVALTLAALMPPLPSSAETISLGYLVTDVITAEALINAAEIQPPQKSGKWAGDPTKFFAGAFSAFLVHEAGHAIANYAIDTDPYLKSVHYGPIPFFTIEPGRQLDDDEHAITSSAGFAAQFLTDEWILTQHPNLRNEDEPFLKGMGTFNFWLGIGYAATAFAGSGPDERDTKGMADSLGWSEFEVGLLVLTPTVLDAYRYKHPNAKWAKTASRISKLAFVGFAWTN